MVFLAQAIVLFLPKRSPFSFGLAGPSPFFFLQLLPPLPNSVPLTAFLCCPSGTFQTKLAPFPCQRLKFHHPSSAEQYSCH
jgi:hypothetical protein